MNLFETALEITILWAIIAMLSVSLTYFWAKRYDRWKNSSWWLTLLFAMGMARIAGGIGSILIFGVLLSIPQEGGVLIKDFLIGGCMAGSAWIVNNRRKIKNK